jgi:hypothetical protein
VRLLAIDPGPVQSAYVIYDPVPHLPRRWAKVPNEEMLERIDESQAQDLAIEMVASYGMPVGADVFETCVWSGRFIQRWLTEPLAGGYHRGQPRRVNRRDVKLHLCGSVRAKDSNIRQALIDRYGPGREKALGKKAAPGPLYGMAGDCWAALGVAVTAAETMA